MSSICVNECFIAVAINNVVYWKRFTSHTFNALKIPVEVNSTNDVNKQSVMKCDDNVIKDVSFSSAGDFLIVLMSSKVFYIYSTDAFVMLSKHHLPRAASKIAFSFDSEMVLVADKTGDVLIYKTKDPNEPGKKIFGHLSLLTGILMSSDNKYIITCDRDEKIRVSNYPGSYNIESFCLGHKEFVTSIHFLPHHQKYLISTSGDGTVRVWDYVVGNEILKINVYCESNIQGVLKNFKEAMKTEDVDIDCLPINYASCCKFDNNSSLLAVSLHLSKEIIVYQIITQGTSLEYKCVYNVNVEDKPVGFIILKNALIVHIQGDKTRVQEWKLNKDGIIEKGFCELIDSDMQNIAVQDTISILYKRKFDNLQEYQNRKKKRIEGQNLSF